MSKQILPDAPKAAHTPGPWRVEQLEDDYGFIPIFGVWHPESDSGENTVCNVFSIADAMLIAAAPELLDACKAFLAWLNFNAGPSQEEGIEDQRLCDEACATAYDAVAKAQGESR